MLKKIMALSLLLIGVLTTGFGCRVVSQQVQDKMQPITLNYWRVWDGPDDFAPAIAAYNKIHPNVTINYRKLSYEEYEQALLNALAEDRGPDIFSINATWVKRYQNKIAFMPDTITMAYPVVKGTIQKQTIPELRTKKSLSLADLKSSFVDAVYGDVVFSYYDSQTQTQVPKVYGLPLAIDNLATFYNKDLLNNAGITDLSDYWDTDFQKNVKLLTKQDSRGQILQAGVALGSGTNIERSSDILAALMLQNGATIIDDQGTVKFEQYVDDKNYNPGMDAIRFFTDFANPSKDVYSWNKTLPDSLDMFIDGKVAIMYNYSYQIPVIKARAPKLNFAVRPFPQIQGRNDPKNVVDYWVETVSKKSKHIPEAWDFIQFIAAQPDVTKTYLASTKRMSAVKSVIKEEMNDEYLGPFAKQILVSKSWYHGSNYDVADKSFKDMLDGVADNPDALDYQARIAAGKISSTIQQ